MPQSKNCQTPPAKKRVANCPAWSPVETQQHRISNQRSSGAWTVEGEGWTVCGGRRLIVKTDTPTATAPQDGDSRVMLHISNIGQVANCTLHR